MSKANDLIVDICGAINSAQAIEVLAPLNCYFDLHLLRSIVRI